MRAIACLVIVMTLLPAAAAQQTPAAVAAPPQNAPGGSLSQPGPIPPAATTPEPTPQARLPVGTVILAPTFGVMPFLGGPGFMLPGMVVAAAIPSEGVAGYAATESAPRATANIPVPGVAQAAAPSQPAGTGQVCTPGQTQVILQPTPQQPPSTVAQSAPMRAGAIPGIVRFVPGTCPPSEAVAGMVQQEQAAPEQPTPTMTVPTGALGPGRISVSLRGADVTQALNLIFEGTGASYVLEPGVQGVVNVSLQDVTRDQALQAVLQSANLSYRKVDNIYYIGARQQAVLPAAPATAVTPGAVTAPTTAPVPTGPPVAMAPTAQSTGIIRARYVNPIDIARIFGGVALYPVTGQMPAVLPTPGFGVSGVAPGITTTTPIFPFIATPAMPITQPSTIRGVTPGTTGATAGAQ